MSTLIIQPWFAAVGHPAQSLINLANIIGKDSGVLYLISMLKDNKALEKAKDKVALFGNLESYLVNTPSIREGTFKALLKLKGVFLKNTLIDKVFFLDAHLVLLALVWPFFYRKNIKKLAVVYLLGPERVTRHRLVKLMVGQFLKRKEVLLFLRTNELVTAWKKAFPTADIKCLPSLELPLEQDDVKAKSILSEKVRLGVLGQIRTGKSLEWLVPFFKENSLYAELTVAGTFNNSVERKRLDMLVNFEGFLDKYLSEGELLRIASEQDYLLMLYDNWDHRLEGAIMFLAARVGKPIITYDKGWCGRMIRTYDNGIFAPERREEFGAFVKRLPQRDSMEYRKLLNGVLAFRSAHSGESIRKMFLEAL